MSVTAHHTYMLVRPPSRPNFPAVVIPARGDEIRLDHMSREEAAEAARMERMERATVRPGRSVQ